METSLRLRARARQVQGKISELCILLPYPANQWEDCENKNLRIKIINSQYGKLVFFGPFFGQA
jgi:hypothetical protein